MQRLTPVVPHITLPAAQLAAFATAPAQSWLPTWLPWSEVRRHAAAPLRDARVAIDGTLGYIMAEALLSHEAAAYIVLTAGVMWVSPHAEPQLYSDLAAMLGEYHAAWTRDLEAAGAAYRAGGGVHYDAAALDALTAPRLVAAGVATWPAQLHVAASAPPLPMRGVHLDVKVAMPGVHPARQRQLADWLNQLEAAGAAPPRDRSRRPSVAAAVHICALGGGRSVAATERMLLDPLMAAALWREDEYAELCDAVAAKDAATAAARRLVQYHCGSPEVAAIHPQPARLQTAAGRVMRRAIAAAARGALPLWQPAPNDWRSLAHVWRQWLPPPPLSAIPDAELGEGVKPLLRWSAFAEVHARAHGCGGRCADMMTVLQMARAAPFPWRTAARPVSDVDTRCDGPDGAVIRDEVAALERRGIVRSPTAAELAAGVATMRVFLVKRDSFPLPPGITDDNFNFNVGQVGALHAAARGLAAAIMEKVRAGVTLTAAVAAARVPAPRARLVWSGAVMGRHALLHDIPFSLPNVERMLGMLKPDSYLSIIDIRACFHSFALDPEDQRHAGFALLHTDSAGVQRRDVRVWTRIPFGAQSSPAATCLITSCWHQIAAAVAREHDTVALGTYIDDTALSAASPDALAAAVAAIGEAAHAVGLEIAQDKTPPPAQRCRILGLTIDTRGGITAVIPSTKRYNSLVLSYVMSAAVQEGRPVPSDLVAELAGRLVHAGALYPSSRAHNAALYFHLLNARGSRRPVQPERMRGALPALEYWTAEERSMPVPIRTQVQARLPKAVGGAGGGSGTGRRTALVVCTDASGEASFGAVTAEEAIWGLFDPASHATMAGSSSSLLEVYSVLASVVHYTARQPGRDLHILTDSMVAACACNAGSARSPGIRRLLQALWHHVEVANVRLHVSHIPRQYNTRADALSKHVTLEAARAALWADSSAPPVPVLHAPHFLLVEPTRPPLVVHVYSSHDTFPVHAHRAQESKSGATPP